MKRSQKFLSLIVGALFTMFSSPYLSFVLMSSHGHSHHIFGEVVDGTLSVVFHHHDENYNHDTKHEHGASSEHGTIEHKIGQSDHVITVSHPNVDIRLSASSTLRNLLPTVIPTVVPIASVDGLERNRLQKPFFFTERRSVSPSVLQTTVLLI